MNRRNFLLAIGNAPLLAQTPTPAPAPELEWIDAKKLTVEGLGFKDVKSPYDRLPGRAEGVVPAAVWNLSRDSAGALVRFTAATPAIHARWTVTSSNLAGTNITAIASSGLDLYAKTDAGKWRWLSVGQPKFPDTTAMLINGIPATEREFMVYLPLRNGVTSLEFGVPKGAMIKPAPARAAASKSIVFYGTSITHGIGASRSGMTHVAMLGRIFNREVINLGFSGNGRMEPEVVKFVAELNPAVFVLDCLPNMGPQQVTERTMPGVKMLREAHPDTPVLLVEDRNIQSGFLVEARRTSNDANHAALREAFASLQAQKVPGIYYLEGANLLGDDGEGTVDGSHPTDLGFTRQAAEFERVLRPLLR